VTRRGGANAPGSPARPAPTRPLPIALLIALSAWLPSAGTAFPAPPDGPEGITAPGRPSMRDMAPAPGGGSVPSGSALSRARAGFRRRYGSMATAARSKPEAIRTAETLLGDAAGESSAALRWVMLDEARRLAVAAGDADAVSRVVRVAAADFGLDGLRLEYRSLREIPLRALRPDDAGELARRAESLATSAETDARPTVALDALSLAMRAWQAAGRTEEARAAAVRHDALLARARDDSRRLDPNRRPGRTAPRRPPDDARRP